MRADLHIHSNLSDGSDSIKELAENIIKAKLDIVALTDHDTVDGIEEIQKLLPSHVKFIKGIELTCKAGDIKCHILGYNINPESDVLKQLIAKGKILRRQKLDTRVKYLKEVWGINLNKTEHDWLYSRNSVVKTHIANILVNRGLAYDNISAMKKYIDDCKTGNTRFDGIEAIDVIKKSGGIPVWAHPLGGEGEAHISEEVLLDRLPKMKTYGIEGMECHYSRYSQKEVEMLVRVAKENDLYITGGSDYHGTNKDVQLYCLNTEKIPVESSKLTILKKI